MSSHGRRLVRVLRAHALWVVAAVALLVSHDLVWFVQVGPGERLATALRSSGHGYWDALSLAIGALALASGLAVALRVALLRRRAARMGARTRRTTPRRYARRAAATWGRLVVVVGLGFALQENAEHFLTHGHLPLLGALVGPEYPLAVPVIGSITALAALLVAAIATVERELVETIVAALLAIRGRAPHRVRERRSLDVLLRPLPLAGAPAGRAPPTLLLGV